MTPRTVCLALALPALAGAQDALIIQHVTLIDGTGGAPVHGASVVVKDGRIAAIGPGDSVALPDGGDRIDARGKTLVPGIINLHGHVGLTKGLVQAQENYTRETVLDNLRTYASYGVTTTTSLGTDMNLVVPIRDAIRAGRLPGLTRVLTALQGFTTRDGYPTTAPGVKGLAIEVSSVVAARAHVKRLADAGADLVKMWIDAHHGAFEKLPPNVFRAIIEEAASRGLVSTAHLYDLQDAKLLADAGLNLMAHSVRDTEVDDDLASKMRAKEITYAPTLTRELSTFVYADSPKWLNDRFFSKGVSANLVSDLRTTLRDAQRADPEQQINRQNLRMASGNLKRLADAGVKIGFGTDTGPPGRFAGYFEHMEAELMVEAGLTPMQVIVAFSRNASEALGIDESFGTLAEGKYADMILLGDNPLDDIRNLRQIDAVFIGGHRVSM